ncbi:uncharacterized protein BJ171DRAFT_577769 [Polychytrium aggregatum]|uniref:uncharacterized protein n=1 Tax=Polychytrium aggregatum TaxID=110093 RepID=UPI0022FEB594|nr:uncharacterized protein BJ171DRAFT_577769 [Polychytrium aggregatum]KAI9208675.1 hypothetical protein BJ171DRAFT_577769 [Polychytrium aggregatum]
MSLAPKPTAKAQQALTALRHKVYDSSRAQLTATDPTAPLAFKNVLAQGSVRTRMLTWHNPDLNYLALANQNPKIQALKLDNVWIEEERAREKALIARGKPPRISTIYGSSRSQKVEEGTKKKKKK